MWRCGGRRGEQVYTRARRECPYENMPAHARQTTGWLVSMDNSWPQVCDSKNQPVLLRLLDKMGSVFLSLLLGWFRWLLVGSWLVLGWFLFGWFLAVAGAAALRQASTAPPPPAPPARPWPIIHIHYCLCMPERAGRSAAGCVCARAGWMMRDILNAHDLWRFHAQSTRKTHTGM